jgi:hypothetical protein
MTLQMDAQPATAPATLLEPIDIDFGAGVAAEPDALGSWLDATLCNELGLATVTRDADGDIPLSYEGTVVYVRQGEPGCSFLTVTALLLEDFEVVPEVFAAVNAINAQVPLAKTIVDVDTVQIVTSVELPVIDSLSPQDLMLAIDTVADTAEYFNVLLQNRFGGATPLDD